MVDDWSVKYEECSERGEVELAEHYIGETKIENV